MMSRCCARASITPITPRKLSIVSGERTLSSPRQAPRSPAPLHRLSGRPDVQLLDYEVEIGLVMRRSIRQRVEVTEQNIGDYIAGVVLCNDVSARDVMFGAACLKWLHGKSYRTF